MPGLAIFCSGQGKQDAAMFERLQPYPEAQALMRQILAAGILPEKAGAWLANPTVDPDLIFSNDLAQPLICLYQMLIWATLKTLLPKPEIFAGYSLGELAAYGCAGVIQPEELVRLAAVRGRLMTDAAGTPQTMVAIIGLKRAHLAEIGAGFQAQIAIVNGSDHFIIGLPSANTNNFIAACRQAGATKTAHLPVTVAAHTSFMLSAAKSFEKTLQTAAFHPDSAKILAGTSGEKVFTRDQMVTALTAQMYRTIDWQACMENAIAYGCRVFLEIGPGNSLARMAQESFPGIEARSVSEFHDIHAVRNWLDAARSR